MNLTALSIYKMFIMVTKNPGVFVLKVCVVPPSPPRPCPQKVVVEDMWQLDKVGKLADGLIQ